MRCFADVLLLENSWLKVPPLVFFSSSYHKRVTTGYKVGRVDQAETALGAEMRLASEKEKEKGSKKAKAAAGNAGKADKIVRR
jgi:hypothetical protein